MQRAGERCEGVVGSREVDLQKDGNNPAEIRQ